MTSTPEFPTKANPVLAIAQLLRVPSSSLAGIAGFAASYALNATLPLEKYLLTAGILFCMTAAACTINDYWDIEQDRINHPDRPLPSGRLSLQQAWWIAVCLFATAVIAAIPLGIIPLILVAVNTILLWNYSHLLKVSGILGNLIVATTISLLIFLSSVVAGRPFVMLYPTGFLFCYALMREVLMDIHDAEGDRAQGIVTIANRWGDRTAFRIIWGLLAGLAISLPLALWLLPMRHGLLFGAFASVLLLSFAIPLVSFQRHHTAAAYQRLLLWERLGMLLGAIGLLGAAPRF
ncbi:MAG TPA: geranylgeranylglycerol-phosphate geranylgeranyltransferase [Synechococcales cyanobacterium M55_K2018_004]|nr:geranylgeranylglycerol-phosphate geranylgeranyltransferase [Synechococcales cyanobacterium M55_K2018_004]